MSDDTAPVRAREAELVRKTMKKQAPRGSSAKFWSLLFFTLFLTLACFRVYRYPRYSTDGLSYMANAVAMHGANIQVIHDTVYKDAKAAIPGPAYDHLTGRDPTEPAFEQNSFRDRALDAYHFAEYLPCFAIRPAFTELLYVLHYDLGVGLVKALVLVPVLSFWLMGWVVLVWLSRYVSTPYACLISLLLLVSTPILDELARATTPDSLSALIVLSAMFLLFERQKFLLGLILLMLSVYVRTDNVLLVLLVLAYLHLAGFGLRALHVATLSAVGIGSVVLINHFSGDYGAPMLYYRIAHVPVAIGEIVPTFGIHDYLAALKTAISDVLHGSHIPFLLMGMVGLLHRPPRRLVGLAATTIGYAAAHLIIYPVAEPRYLGVFFAAMAIVLGASVSSYTLPHAVRDVPTRRLVSRFVQAATASLW